MAGFEFFSSDFGNVEEKICLQNFTLCVLNFSSSTQNIKVALLSYEEEITSATRFLMVCPVRIKILR